MRKATSLTLLISFIPLILTSVILYIAPEGRVAYWADWHLLGLSKTQWSDIHINLGFLFLAAGLIHLWLNWRPILAYLKNKAKELVVFTPAMWVALLLNLVFLVGTLAYIPPFSSILNFGHFFKERAGEVHGEPPYGHAELSSLELFARRTGGDVEVMSANLKAAGIQFDSNKESILAIANRNHLTPKAVYEASHGKQEGKQEELKSLEKGLPAMPPGGVGRIALKDLCAKYGLDQNEVVQKMAKQGVTLDVNLSMKENAGKLGIDPHALYDQIYQATQGSEKGQ